MKIPGQFVQELKTSLNIIDVAGGFMRLVKKGKNYFALCPFHGEKTPSFSLNEQLQTYHCFGCGKGGDVIQLVMELEAMTYVEAIQFLAEKANLKVPAADPETEKQTRDKKFIYTVMEEAVRFYQRCLAHEDGRGAREYLDRRKIAPETREKFRLGYAPPNGFHLVSYLRSMGIRDHVMREAGLAKVSERTDQLYDQFRSRLMIPISDLHGRVVAFGGRILGEGEPKYLNSQETPIYHKSHHLFGLNLSVKEIRAADQAILVEGYFDMIVPWQAGVANIVASLGTSLTQPQVKLLGRFTRNVTVSFDPDAAGSTAAYRSVEIFLENDFECRVAILPGGQDPDTCVLTAGADGYRQVLAQAEPFLDYVWRRGVESVQGDFSVKKKVKLMEGMFPFILRLPAEMERSRYLSGMAKKMELDEATLFRQFNHFSRTRKVNEEQLGQAAVPELLPAEKELLQYLFQFPELASRITSGANVTFSGLASSNILQGIEKLVGETGCLKLNELEERLTDSDRVLLHRVHSAATRVVTESEARSCLLTLRRKVLEKRNEEITGRLHAAEAGGDMPLYDRLLDEKKKLREEINQCT